MKHSPHLLFAAMTVASAISVIPVEAQPFVPAPMFGNNGGKSVDILGGADIGIRHALLPDGKLLLGGGGYDINCNCYHIALMKMDTLCGKLDATFGNGGTIGHIFDQRSTLQDMVVLPNGKILACGQNAPDNSLGTQVASVYRFNADGSPDLTMNGTGWRQDRFNTANTCINNAILPLNNGRFYATGSFSGADFGVGVMRYLENGDLDSSYSDDGKAWTNFGGAFTYPISLDGLLLPDSGVLVLAKALTVSTMVELILVRFNADGTLDQDFGTDGVVLTGLFVSTEGRPSAALLPNGRILVGSSPDQPINGFSTARFLPTGAIDPTYGSNGISHVDLDGAGDYAQGLEVLSDGSSIQFGTYGPITSYIVKRNANGQVDASFGSNGMYTIPLVAADMSIRGGLMLGPGRMMAYGTNALDMIAVKLTTDPTAGLFADLGPDTTICAGTPFALDAGFPGSTYLWSNTGNATTGTTQMFNTLPFSTTYRVAITNAMGCTDRDTIQVQVAAPPNIPLIVLEGNYLYAQGFGDFQWYLNGTPIPGAVGDTWTPLQNGTYTVSATVGFCSSFSPPYVLLSVGIDANSTIDKGFTAYPNPTDGSVSVMLPVGEEAAILELFDPLGRRIELAPSAISARGSNLRQIDLSGFSSGVYMLQLMSSEGARANLFVVKR